jgi:hypothetical protein
MARPTSVALTGIRLLYALFWVTAAVTPLFVNAPFPQQPTQAANDFWDAIAATGFMIPLTGVTYFVGGALCLLRRTAPLGLAFLSAPLGVIVPFNVLLARQAGPWIAIVLVHVVLLFAYRAAFVPLWSYRPELEAVRHPERLEAV